MQILKRKANESTLEIVSRSNTPSKFKEGINILDTSKWAAVQPPILRYLDLAQQYHFLERLASRAPASMDLQVSWIRSYKDQVVGNTAIEGKAFQNDLLIVKIGDSSGELNVHKPAPDPVMFFDCGIHAREWISPATCNYIIQVQLTPTFISLCLTFRSLLLNLRRGGNPKRS